MSENIWLFAPILLPILVGILLLFLASQHDKLAMRVSLFTAILNSVLLFFVIGQGSKLTLLKITENLVIRLQLDDIGLIFLAIVSIIWILASIFAQEYMGHERNLPRFFAFFTMSLGAMVGIGFSGNLFTFYLFYEFMTLMTYPLVINEGSDRAKRAGTMYLAYSLLGASLTLMALLLVHSIAGSNDFLAGGILNSLLNADNQAVLILVYFFAVLGYGAKAGMYPLHAWLPKAHPVAPAPASAVLSGLITKAGVLGIIRLTYYIYGADLVRNTWAHQTLLILVLVTIFLGSMLAMKAKELKIRLAYSSISQVSYVLLGILLLDTNGFIGGVLQIFSHAMAKNLLFFAVGAITYMTGKTNVDQIDGEGKTMPITLTAFTIASLSLIGIPPLSGYVTKYFLAMGSLGAGNEIYGITAIAVLIISSMLTAGYLLPIIIKAFFPGSQYDYANMTKFSSKPLLTVPLILLAIGIVVLGIYPGPIINFITTITQSIL